MKTGITFLLLTLFFSVSAQQIVHQQVYSAKMHKNINAIIVTPNIQKDVRYKTIYILHGYSGNPTGQSNRIFQTCPKKRLNSKRFILFPTEIITRGM